MTNQTDHFATGHLLGDLRRRVLRGSASMLGSEVAKVLIALGSTMVLARLLLPSDFGLFAMVAIVTGLLHVIVESGFSQVAVQREDVSHEQLSALFWFNMALGAAVAVGIVALSPLLAWFYKEPQLKPIAGCLAIPILLSAAGLQHRALLRRQMAWGKIRSVEIASQIAASAAAIWLAYFTAVGVWSLVASAIVGAAALAALLWWASSWRPSFVVRAAGVGALIAFGSNVTGVKLLNYVSRKADNLLIGWMWGAIALGLYSRAYQLLMMPLGQIGHPLALVVVPALSRLQNQPARWRALYLNAIAGVMLIAAPVSCLLFIFAEEIILLLLGERWVAAVPIFRFLSISAWAQPLMMACNWIQLSRGRTDRMLRWQLYFATPLTLASFVVGLPFGPEGVALAYSLCTVALAYPSIAWAAKGHPVRPREILGSILGPCLAAIVAALATYLTITQIGLNAASPAARLAGGAAVYAIVYTVAVLASARSRSVLLMVLNELLLRKAWPRRPAESNLS